MEQENHLKIQVQNLHCYSCSQTFTDFNTFCSHRHIDNTSGHSQNTIPDKSEPRTADSSNNCDFTSSEQDQQIHDIEKVQPSPKKKRTHKDKDTFPSTDNNLSLDQPSTTKKKSKIENKLVNFYHCTNCYQVFNRLSKLKDHFSNCTQESTETFQEFQLNKGRNNINNNNATKPPNPNTSNNYIGNETGNNNEQYFELEVRCTKCQLDFIFFDDLLDHLKTLHLKPSNKPLHPHSLSLASSSSLQPQQKSENKRKSKVPKKKIVSIQTNGIKSENLEDSTPVQTISNEENNIDSLPDDDDDDIEFQNDFPTDDFYNPEFNENDNVAKINEIDPEWNPSQEDKTDAEREKSLFLSSLSPSGKKQKNRKRPNTSNDSISQLKKKRVRKQQQPKKEILCDVPGCGENFTSQQTLREHKKIIHDIIIISKNKQKPMTTTGEEVDGEKRFMCDTCGRSFRKKFDLQQHFLTHTGERKWKCSFEGCGQSCNRLTLLRRHERSRHNNELRHLCFTCGLAFRDNCSLQSHVNLHTGDKPYKCQVENCDKAYAGARALRAHMETHKNERNFQCHHCAAAFNFFNVLKKHLKSHERTKNVKPFKSSPS